MDIIGVCQSNIKNKFQQALDAIKNEPFIDVFVICYQQTDFHLLKRQCINIVNTKKNTNPDQRIRSVYDR